MKFMVLMAIGLVFVSTCFGAGRDRRAMEQLRAQERQIQEQQAQLREVRRQLEIRTWDQVHEIARAEMERRRIQAEADAQRDRQEQVSRDRARLETMLNNALSDMSGSIRWTRARCAEVNDANVSNADEARGRTAWALRCFRERVNDTSLSQIDRNAAAFYVTAINGLRGSPTITSQDLYPTFGRISFDRDPGNPDRFIVNTTFPAHDPFPTNEGASCSLLNGWSLAGFCVSGCFTPDQRIAFADSPGHSIAIPIGLAYRNRFSQALTLSHESTRHNLAFVPASIENYTVSLADAWHDIVDVTTLSGLRLKVTTNHPLVLSSGVLVRADALAPGQALIRSNGAEEPIIEINRTRFFGKVYNLNLTSGDPLSHIVIAEELLAGTGYLQNEGRDYLNRMILRGSLPAEFLSAE